MVKVHRRRVAGWVAIFAILLNAFAPAVSHALASSGTAPWLEVCTGGSLATPGTLRDQGEQPAKPATAAQHCPFCAPHGASFAAPPAAISLAVVADAGTQRVTVAATQASLPLPWRAAHSRAPPAL